MKIDEKIENYLNEDGLGTESRIDGTIRILSQQKQIAMKGNEDEEVKRAKMKLYDNMLDAVDALGQVNLYLKNLSITRGSDLELLKTIISCRKEIERVCKELVK